MRKSMIFGLLALVGWLCAGMAQAQVRDSTGTFSSTAIEQANETIRQIKQGSGKDVLVEVFPEIPADRRSSYSDANKDPFFRNWASVRAAELNLNGIYVLVCRKPGYLMAEAGKNTRLEFPKSDQDHLAQIMLGQFKTGNFDAGLSQGLQFILQELRKNHGAVGARGHGGFGDSGGGGGDSGSGGSF